MQRLACTAVSFQRACARCYAPGIAQNQRTIAMRASLPAFAVILACGVAPVAAQSVIDVPNQKPALPPAQDAAPSQSPSSAQTPVRPQENPLPAPAGRYSFNRVD